jgi:hypothetical protein
MDCVMAASRFGGGAWRHAFGGIGVECRRQPRWLAGHAAIVLRILLANRFRAVGESGNAPGNPFRWRPWRKTGRYRAGAGLAHVRWQNSMRMREIHIHPGRQKMRPICRDAFAAIVGSEWRAS